MPRPISLTIDTAALRANLARVRRSAGSRFLWAVVKADAYGHGLKTAMQAFADADGFATLEASDAVLLRGWGWKKPILLLEGFFDADDLRVIADYSVETNVHSRWMIDMIRRHAPYENGLLTRVKINSGMNRLGFRPDQYEEVKAELESIEGCRVLGPVTHFANSEPTYSPDGRLPVAKQLARMGALAEMDCACMANSSATLCHPEVKGGGVRAGIVLYGVSPDGSVAEEELGIVPAQTLAAEIIALQDLAPGECTGYGSRWQAERPSRVAVVACGYADGYPRMPDGVPVFVEGREAPIVGAVSMDMLEIDVTDIPGAHVGSLVELWGKNIRVNRVAKLCGTIGYDLICAVKPRVPVVVG